LGSIKGTREELRKDGARTQRLAKDGESELRDGTVLSTKLQGPPSGKISPTRRSYATLCDPKGSYPGYGINYRARFVPQIDGGQRR